MNAVHIKTEGMFCEECPLRIEMEIEHLPGVKAACTYRSIHLTSVLFDPELVDVDTICAHIANAGFKPQILAGGGSRTAHGLSEGGTR